jgi:hypothetical protein
MASFRLTLSGAAMPGDLALSAWSCASSLSLHLGKLTLPDLARSQFILLRGTVFPDEDRDFVAGEFAAQFSLAEGNGTVALLRPFGKPFQQVRGYAGEFESIRPPLNLVAQLMHLASERVAVNFREILGPFEDSRAFEGQQLAPLRITSSHIENERVRMQVRIEGAAFAVPEHGSGDGPGGDVALVDPAAGLVAGMGFQFAQGLSDSGFMGDEQPLVAAEEGLDRDGLGGR